MATRFAVSQGDCKGRPPSSIGTGTGKSPEPTSRRSSATRLRGVRRSPGGLPAELVGEDPRLARLRGARGRRAPGGEPQRDRRRSAAPDLDQGGNEDLRMGSGRQAHRLPRPGPRARRGRAPQERQVLRHRGGPERSADAGLDPGGRGRPGPSRHSPRPVRGRPLLVARRDHDRLRRLAHGRLQRPVQHADLRRSRRRRGAAPGRGPARHEHVAPVLARRTLDRVHLHGRCGGDGLDLGPARGPRGRGPGDPQPQQGNRKLGGRVRLGRGQPLDPARAERGNRPARCGHVRAADLPGDARHRADRARDPGAHGELLGEPQPGRQADGLSVGRGSHHGRRARAGHRRRELTFETQRREPRAARARARRAQADPLAVVRRDGDLGATGSKASA